MNGYRIEPLARHDRSAFTSGSPALDSYFRERVTQDVRRHIASCFVVMAAEGDIAGFYTLAATSLAFSGLSDAQTKALPRYPVVPAILLRRLAIASTRQGRRLGGALVADAILRSTSSDIAAFAMVVDAKDEAAARFYNHLGFEALPDSPIKLIRKL